MKIICVGRNYDEHIKELKNTKPKSPILFLKPDTSILKNDQPFFLPRFSQNIEHEVEIIVKIKKIGKNIDKKFAHKYYDEISLGIDFTARDLQQKLKSKGLPWEKAKAFDFSAVIGKWFQKSHFFSINELTFKLKKNDIVVQKGNTNQMIWNIDHLIEEISKFFTLKIGDIIFTGTPSGVGSIKINDKLEGFINNEKIFSTTVK
jgi:2-keto-4-pentenoate hydratase/2-oxohepta-3-ene-1,7-dioic acid hydratase in catechol pathway